jgi:hypothetical protein
MSKEIVKREVDKEFLELQNNPDFGHFVEQLTAYQSEWRNKLEGQKIEYMHGLGEEVVKSGFYEKFQHGKKLKFIQFVAAQVGLDWRRVYEAVDCYTKFPGPETLQKELEAKFPKLQTYTWNTVRSLLALPETGEVCTRHDWEIFVIKKCRKCNVRERVDEKVVLK